MKHIKQLSIIVIILLFTAGCSPKKQALEMEEEITSWESPLDIEMIGSEKEGNFCIVGEGEGEPRIIPDKYYIETTAYTGTTYEIEQTYDTYRIEETDRFEIGIYDFHTLELIKTLDMREIMGPYLEDWQIWSTGHWVGEYKGKYYLTQPLTKKQTEEEIIAKKEEEFRGLWIDIEDETAGWIDKEPNPVYSDQKDNIWMLVGTLILNANGYEDTHVSNLYTLKDTSYISIPTSSLPEKNEKLYSLFPDLKNVSREEGIYANIFLHPETNNMEAISLILNDGERLDFDALKPNSDGYYGGYGKNGKRHRITKEEYEQFQRDYEEYFDKEKERMQGEE